MHDEPNSTLLYNIWLKSRAMPGVSSNYGMHNIGSLSHWYAILVFTFIEEK